MDGARNSGDTHRRHPDMSMHNNIEAFSFTGRIRSITHAVRGIVEMLKSQHNAWLHAAATIAVTVTGFVVGITRIEWCLLVLAIVSVWVAKSAEYGV
jgi:diacylglycerol kinase (ATP)